MSYERVKKNWITGLWDVAALKHAYRVGIITKEQYRYIKTLPHAGQQDLEKDAAQLAAYNEAVADIEAEEAAE